MSWVIIIKYTILKTVHDDSILDIFSYCCCFKINRHATYVSSCRPTSAVFAAEREFKDALPSMFN